MISDVLENLNRYAVPKTEAILKFIANNNCANLPDGEMKIEGRDLFVRIMSYFPKPAEENRFETHRIYADVQYVVSGAEIMQTARLNELSPVTEYDEQGDYQFYKITTPTTDLIIQAGEFAVFYPNQPHRPSCSYEGYKGLVKKLVFKVKINA